jgi:FtsZ-interacting cell division protein ZipA
MEIFVIALIVVAVMLLWDAKRKQEDAELEKKIRKTEQKKDRVAEAERDAIRRGKEAAEEKDAIRKAKETAEEKDAIRKAKETAEEKDAIRKAKETAEENLRLEFSTLKSNLPFYTSNRPPSAELAEHDKKMWEDVTKLVNAHDAAQATLYFVKIKSLLDDNEYYKIGITTVGVKARLQKSTQVELIQTVCSFSTELWKAAFLEYHFLREFRL